MPSDRNTPRANPPDPWREIEIDWNGVHPCGCSPSRRRRCDLCSCADTFADDRCEHCEEIDRAERATRRTGESDDL